jgi:hypothetical protein
MSLDAGINVIKSIEDFWFAVTKHPFERDAAHQGPGSPPDRMKFERG